MAANSYSAAIFFVLFDTFSKKICIFAAESNLNEQKNNPIPDPYSLGSGDISSAEAEGLGHPRGALQER